MATLIVSGVVLVAEYFPLNFSWLPSDAVPFLSLPVLSFISSYVSAAVFALLLPYFIHLARCLHSLESVFIIIYYWM